MRLWRRQPPPAPEAVELARILTEAADVFRAGAQAIQANAEYLHSLSNTFNDLAAAVITTPATDKLEETR